MKKKFMTAAVVGLALSLTMAFGLTGCGSSEEAVPEDSQDVVEEQAEDIEEDIEDAAADVEAAAEDAAEADNAASDNAAAKDQTISKKKALKIARRDAGLSKADIDYSNIHLDYDDGRTEYEIEFHKGMTEYEYTLDAFTGDILEKDVDTDND